MLLYFRLYLLSCYHVSGTELSIRKVKMDVILFFAANSVRRSQQATSTEVSPIENLDLRAVETPKKE